MSPFGVGLRLLILGLYALGVGPLQWLALRCGWPILHTIPMQFHRLFLALFEVRITERGKPLENAATLVVSNHVSWLDIPVIGSLRPLSFIAKAEVEEWPVIGLLARFQRCVFIDRARRKATAEVNVTVGQRLAKGEALVLFAEGTTGDGNYLLPFRSSLVGAAQTALVDPNAGSVRLQPLALAYTRRNGLPVTRRERPFIAWYGNMELASHLGAFVRNGPLDVVVTWGEPILFQGNRKEATAKAETAVRQALQES